MSSVHRVAPEGPMLYACAQAGCQACVERLLRQHAGLVHWVIRCACGSDLPYGELLHEGQIALWHAIRHYDPGRGVAFSTYAVSAIRHRLWDVVARAQRPPGYPALPPVGDPAALAAAAWQRQAVRAALQAALAYLPDRSYHISVAAYGLDRQPPLSLAAIGRLYGLSRERIRQLRNAALVVLRLPAPTPAQTLPEPHVPDSPFHHLLGFTRRLLRDTRDIPAAPRRLLSPNFVATFRWPAVRPLLPLRLVVAPTQPDTAAAPPVWQPRYCRSHYVWLPSEASLGNDPSTWQGLDDFDIILRLFDFSAWRPILGQRFASQYGPPPFDPISLGLSWLLARWRGWSWPQLVTELHSPERGQGYVRRLGFCPDDLPSASTYRMALNATPPDWVVQCADSLALSLLAYGLLPGHATFPHDPPERGVSVALDSQLIAARSHMRCRHVTVHRSGKGVYEGAVAVRCCKAARHSWNGLRLRAAQVWSKLAKVKRVLVPSALRVPPLILRMMTNGRILRSVRLWSAVSPGTKMNWNNSSWRRNKRLASTQHGWS